MGLSGIRTGHTKCSRKDHIQEIVGKGRERPDAAHLAGSGKICGALRILDEERRSAILVPTAVKLLSVSKLSATYLPVDNPHPAAADSASCLVEYSISPPSLISS